MIKMHSVDLKNCLKLIGSIFYLLVGLIISNPASASLLSDLQDGHHVLLMRHADAPGIGDPTGYKLEQCSTQRNIDEHGKQQARRIGEWLSKQGVQESIVLSSPWCRCLDTARLLNKGVVGIESALGSFFDDMRQEQAQTLALERLIKSELSKKQMKPIILVTHHVNIQAYTSKVVGVGDMVLVKVNNEGKYVSHQLFPSP